MVVDEKYLDVRMIDLFEAILSSEWAIPYIEKIPPRLKDVGSGELRKVFNAMTTDECDPDGKVPPEQYRVFAKGFLSTMPGAIADIMVQGEYRIADDDPLQDGEYDFGNGIIGRISNSLNEIDYPIENVPPPCVEAMNARKRSLEEEMSERAESSRFECKLFQLTEDEFEQWTEREFELKRVENNNNRDFQDEHAGARVNPQTWASLRLSRSGKNRYAVTITPGNYSISENATTPNYKGDKSLLYIQYADRREADHDINGIVQHQNIAKRTYYHQLVKYLSQGFDALDPSQYWEVLQEELYEFSDAFPIVYDITLNAHNRTKSRSQRSNDQLLYDGWSELSSLKFYAENNSNKLMSDDPRNWKSLGWTMTDEASKEVRDLTKKYTPEAIARSFKLFHRLHSDYERTLSKSFNRDLGALEEITMKHTKLSYTGKTRADYFKDGFNSKKAIDRYLGEELMEGYVRIDPSELFLFAMAFQESRRELEIRIMEAQKMASGADDKVWFEVTGANNTIASAISKLTGLKHYVVQSKNKGSFLWMIPNDESHFVHGFVADKNLHYKRMGLDSEVDVDHVAATCEKLFTADIINAHQGQCNACKTIKKNEESARQAEIEKNAKAFDQEVVLITRMLKTGQKLSAEQEVIAKELGIDKQSAMAITDASKQPFTTRNSQARDGQPRSTIPSNPKVNNKGNMITTSQIHNQSISGSLPTTLEAGTTKMENGVKVIATPPVQSLNIEDQQLKAIEDEIGRLVFEKRDLEDKIKAVDTRTVELMESWEKLDAYIKNQQAEIVISDETKDALDKAEKALEEAKALAEKEKEEQEQRHASDLEDLRKMLTSLQT